MSYRREELEAIHCEREAPARKSLTEAASGRRCDLLKRHNVRMASDDRSRLIGRGPNSRVNVPREELHLSSSTGLTASALASIGPHRKQLCCRPNPQMPSICLSESLVDFIQGYDRDTILRLFLIALTHEDQLILATIPVGTQQGQLFGGL